MSLEQDKKLVFDQNGLPARAALFAAIDNLLEQETKALGLEGNWHPISIALDLGERDFKGKNAELSVQLTRRTSSILFWSVEVTSHGKTISTAQAVWGKGS